MAASVAWLRLFAARTILSNDRVLPVAAWINAILTLRWSILLSLPIKSCIVFPSVPLVDEYNL